MYVWLNVFIGRLPIIELLVTILNYSVPKRRKSLQQCRKETLYTNKLTSSYFRPDLFLLALVWQCALKSLSWESISIWNKYGKNLLVQQWNNGTTFVRSFSFFGLSAWKLGLTYIVSLLVTITIAKPNHKRKFISEAIRCTMHSSFMVILCNLQFEIGPFFLPIAIILSDFFQMHMSTEK